MYWTAATGSIASSRIWTKAIPFIPYYSNYFHVRVTRSRRVNCLGLSFLSSSASSASKSAASSFSNSFESFKESIYYTLAKMRQRLHLLINDRLPLPLSSLCFYRMSQILLYTHVQKWLLDWTGSMFNRFHENCTDEFSFLLFGSELINWCVISKWGFLSSSSSFQFMWKVHTISSAK